MAKRQRPAPSPERPKPDLDSFPNDDLEEQLAADIQTITDVEQELSQLVGQENRAAGWLRMLGRILPNNARCAKSHRVDPLTSMSAERIQQCRQETLQHSRAHTEEAKVTLQWYKENTKERRDQLPPWLKSRAEALSELQVLLWRSSPEGRLAILSAHLEGLQDMVENLEKAGHPAAPGIRQRYEGYLRIRELLKQIVAEEDPKVKARLERELKALEAEEAQALEAMRHEQVPTGGGANLPEPKPPLPSPLTGRWRIISVEQPGDRLVSDQARGHVELEANGAGRFKLGHARGELDGKMDLRDGKEGIDFSWEGTDNTGDRWGRGWAVLDGAELHGTIYFHKGGESKFVAKRTRKRRQSST